MSIESSRDKPVKLLTETEFAKLAGVSKRTVRRLIDSGRLTAVDYSTSSQKNYRISPDEVTRVRPPATVGSPTLPPDPPAFSPPPPRGRRRRSPSAAKFIVWPAD